MIGRYQYRLSEHLKAGGLPPPGRNMTRHQTQAEKDDYDMAKFVVRVMYFGWTSKWCGSSLPQVVC